MKQANSLARQKGVALVVGLMLLLVSSIVALAAFQSGKFQEQMASNQYNKAVSFMAAEQGAANFLATVPSFDAVTWTNHASDQAAGGGGFYRIAITDPTANPLNVSVTGFSRRSANTEALAVSTLNMEVELVGAPPPGTGAGINLVGSLGVFEVPDSNSFQAQGADGGPAVAALLPNDQEAIEDALEDKGRLGNYLGGIGQSAFPGIWRDPNLLQEFVQAVCTGAAGRCTNPPHDVPAGTVWNKNTKPTPDPNLTVIRGDAEVEFKGNDTGAGILIVTGDLKTKGTPSWDGIIIVLGGTFDIGGGGNGGVNGSLYILDVNTGSATWEPAANENVNFKSSGGGNALFRHDCPRVEQSLNLIPVPAGADASTFHDDLLQSFGCGGSGTGTPGPNSFRVLRYVEVLPVQ
jgi:hypothetical protein